METDITEFLAIGESIIRAENLRTIEALLPLLAHTPTDKLHAVLEDTQAQVEKIKAAGRRLYLVKNPDPPLPSN